MGTRYTIRLGDKTTVGGIVQTAENCSVCFGKAMAVEGSQIKCPKCKSIGFIQIAGTRVPSTIYGKEIALSDDLCICGCHPPPRLIASQTQHMRQGVGPSLSHEQWLHDERFTLTDSEGNPLIGAAYTAKLPNGEIHHGITDEYGDTLRYHLSEPGQIEVHVGHFEG
jgi:uncharacterized Zn-binding protein involved in type VI secretion